MGRVLVSSEIEEIVDKDNILGFEDYPGDALVTIKSEKEVFQGALLSLDSKGSATTVSLRVPKEKVNSILSLLNYGEKMLSIGENIFIPLNKENQTGYSLEFEKDMYIWKINIDNCE